MRLLVPVVVVLLACGCDSPASAPGTAALPAGPIAVITLPTPEPGAAAAAATPVTVSTQAAQVEIRLTGFDRPADELTAELEASTTGEVRRWPVDAVSGEAGAVSVTVPAYAVGAGAHVLTIWAGDADLLRRLVFQVVTR